MQVLDSSGRIKGTWAGAFTSGSVLFVDSGGNPAQDNAKFFWNDSTFSLILGGTTALATGGLTVYGSASQKTAVFRANATTPGNVLEVQDSSANVLFNVTGPSNAVNVTLNQVSTASTYVQYQQSGTLAALVGINGAANALVGSSAAGDLVFRSQSKTMRFTVDGGTVWVLAIGGTTLTLADAVNIATNATTGTKIGTATTQKISLWNKAPDVQPTNAIAAAAFVTNTSLIANDSATFGGYTLGQIAAALIRIGALA